MGGAQSRLDRQVPVTESGSYEGTDAAGGLSERTVNLVGLSDGELDIDSLPVPPSSIPGIPPLDSYHACEEPNTHRSDHCWRNITSNASHRGAGGGRTCCDWQQYVSEHISVAALSDIGILISVRMAGQTTCQVASTAKVCSRPEIHETIMGTRIVYNAHRKLHGVRSGVSKRLECQA